MSIFSFSRLQNGVRFFALALATFLLSQCGSKDTHTGGHIDPAFGAYISSYSAGMISSESGIRVMLSQSMAGTDMIGKEAGAKLFQISPSVSGKTTWVDSRTLEFKPDKRLKSGESYTVQFALNKLMDVPKPLSTFEFKVQVLRQDFEIRVENLKPVEKNKLDIQKLEGLVQTADYADKDQITKHFKASQGNTPLEVTWQHSPDGKIHNFEIFNIKRQEAASQVSLQMNGKGLEIDKSDALEVEIPALGDFKLMEARVVQGGNQHVALRFSDPIKEKQNLQGLIRLGQISDLNFTIVDNEVFVYPSVRQKGSMTLFIEPGIRNILDYRMSKGTQVSLMFEQIKPSVRFIGKGTILPSTEGMVLPFEAVGLKAVEVEIVKVFEDNVLQFLQVNQVDGNRELRRVGKPVLKKVIRLDQAGMVDFERWNRYTLDLKSLISTEPGAIYQVRINFKKSHSTYFCNGDSDQEDDDLMDSLEESWDAPSANEYSYWDSYDNYYYDEDYDWRERENPCHSSYYGSSRKITRNILATDLGVITKKGEPDYLHAFVTDMRTTETISGAKVEVYNYQQQLVGTAETDSEGKVKVNLSDKPYVLVAQQGAQKTYVRLDEGSSLSLSSFDVSGEKIKKGIKGFIYGERGVWRPGDTLHISFILEDKNKLLPNNHPVVFELFSPQNQLVNRQVKSQSVNGIYYFATATDPDAQTGNYTAKIKVGGTDFSQSLKVETVKPNKLKVNFDLGTDKIQAGSNNVRADLDVKWLHGATARNLKVEYDVVLSKGNTRFKGYESYQFEDPSVDFSSEPIELINDRVDEQGKARIVRTLNAPKKSPGVLNATFRGKVFEESGDFSVDRFSIPFYPYEAFVGVQTPLGDKSRGMLLTDTTHKVDIVRVDAGGKATGNVQVEVDLFKLEWRWWWETANSGLANYMSNSYRKSVSSAKINLVNGKGSWNMRINYPEWGRYFLRVCDPSTGHCTGKVIYMDWPGWAGRGQRRDLGGASMLSFAAEKNTYAVGEEVKINIPSSANGRALVSVENGSRVIATWWVPTQDKETPFKFVVTDEMTPNIFVNITYLQRHAQTSNDLPIRMYGIIPLLIENPATKLEPQLKLPAQIEPGQQVKIQVSEANKQKMSYTIAVVDEGLLDLTRFRTPEPWLRFYAREALGVRTWDMYDQVIGAYGARLERLLAIGGDDYLVSKDQDARAQRFKPVVKYLGPFTLEKGKTNEHSFVMPQYIGSVKTMLVAAYEGAYGNTEQVTPVRQPLMVFGTLPRVLGPEEKVTLPVTLFANDPSIKNTKVEVQVSGPLVVKGNASQQTTLSADADKTITFDLEVAARTGVAKVKMIATSGNFKSEHEIEIEVRNPNLPVTRVFDGIVEPGQSWEQQVKSFGLPGTNAAVVEVSSLPPVNLDARMRYLLNYPHGCVEQTTSAVMPQLYLNQVRELKAGEEDKIRQNILAGIQRLSLFQTRDGGFGYWQGAEQADIWSTSYAGHFLVEAQAKGYPVSDEVLNRWKRFQRSKTAEWKRNNQVYNSDLMQAYRLYTLALAGAPETAAMNRLRESNQLNSQAAWMLAAAYAQVGQKDAAKALISSLNVSIKEYIEYGYTYGSAVRDKALILETLILLDERSRGFDLLKELSKALSDNNYYMNTQATAFALKAVGSFAGKREKGNDIQFELQYGSSKSRDIRTALPIAQNTLELDEKAAQPVKVKNTSKGPLFVSLSLTGTPARGAEEASESNLSMTVRYTDLKGNSLDVSDLSQGTSFMAEVMIGHTGISAEYKNLALSQVFPSGWEISNARMDGASGNLGDAFSYQDIRDDRVLTYFDLKQGQRKVYKVLLTATYAGEYYLPGAHCEAMYDNNVSAKAKGMVVSVK